MFSLEAYVLSDSGAKTTRKKLHTYIMLTKVGKRLYLIYTVDPTFRTSPLKIRTPRYYGQFSWSLPKAGPTFSLNSTRLVRTPH